MPALLNPWVALYAAAAAVPLLVLLYFLKLRRKERAISSTVLWSRAVQDLQVNAPFQRLRRNLLLFLQLLLLAALLAALARPVSFGAARPGKTTVLLVDRSASMNARVGAGSRTRLDAAKDLARDAVDGLPTDAQATLITFDSEAATLVPMTSDRRRLKAAIDAITPTDRATRAASAYTLAAAATPVDVEATGDNTGVPDPPQVLVFSDGRTLDTAGDLSAGQATVNLVRVGDDKAANAAVVAFSARRNYDDPTKVNVFARLANFGPDAVDADVQLSVAPLPREGEAPSELEFSVSQVRAALHLLPQRWTPEQRAASPTPAREAVDFELELADAAVLRVALVGAGDALAADDAAHVVVPPAEPLKVLLVTEGNEFLRRSLEVLRLGTLDVVNAAKYEADKAVGYDVTFFDRVQPAWQADAGSFVYFGCLPPASTPPGVTWATGADGVPLVGEGEQTLDWDRDGPIFRGLNLGGLYVGETRRLARPDDAQTLLDGRGGPLVVLHRQGRRQHLVVAFDLLQSNWPLRETFPLFMYNATNFLAASQELALRESFRPGATPRVPRELLDRTGTTAASVRLVAPDGSDRDVPVPRGEATGDFVLPALDTVGLWRARPSVVGVDPLAVNLLDESESNLVPGDLAGTVSAERSSGGAGGDVDAAGRQERREWWPWLVAAGALPLLMFEWWVYTRRAQI